MSNSLADGRVRSSRLAANEPRRVERVQAEIQLDALEDPLHVHNDLESRRASPETLEAAKQISELFGSSATDDENKSKEDAATTGEKDDNKKDAATAGEKDQNKEDDTAGESDQNDDEETDEETEPVNDYSAI